jgi:hypothetical protein
LNIGTHTNRVTTWGAGPIAILGVKSKLLGRIGLSAELSVNALYQFSNSSGADDTQYGTVGQPYSTGTSTTSSNSHGWQVTLDDIRIGVILAL